MSKIWEETWERTERGENDGKPYCNEVINGSPTEVFLGSGERLQLACAAPDMARVLLALEVPECVWCHHSEHDRHRSGCPIGEALDKAGTGDWPAEFNPLRRR